MDQRPSHSLLADSSLMMITFFWALSYTLVKIGLGDGITEMNLISLRFILASILIGLVFFRRIKTARVEAMKHGFFIGLILFLIYITSTFALRFTTVGNSAFLTSLSVMVVPILMFICFREVPERRVFFGVILAVSGMFFLLYNPAIRMNMGDILSIVTAALCGIHIIYIGRIAAKVDALILGVFQVFTVTLLSTITALILGNYQLPSAGSGWLSVILLGILCTAIPFIVQPVAQQYTSTTRAALIFSTEIVFAAILAYVFLGEVLSPLGYIGGVLVFAGILVAELDFFKLFTSKCN